MTHIIHRHLHVTPPLAARGEGVFITDAAGRQYLDACGGAAVSCLGHGHPDVLAAMHAQIDRLAYAHTSFFTSEAAERLADQLARRFLDSEIVLVANGVDDAAAAEQSPVATGCSLT